MTVDTLRPEGELKTRVLQEVVDMTEREGGLISGHVPLDLIDDKDTPVNEQNLALIGTQLDDESTAKGNDGQIQPIILGLVEGRLKLDIIDGFHRFEKFKQLGNPTIFATILDVTLEELLDKRIQNTRNHDGLQFSRAIQWVREAWDLHPESDRLTASQAFILGRITSSNGRGFGLEEDDKAGIMDWIDQKAALWGLVPMTIYKYLHTDDNVADDLISNSRPDPAQAAAANSLPASTLAIIGKQIPRREEVQRAVADAIVTHRLGGSGISGILSDVKGMDDEKAIDYLNGVDFTAYKEKISQKPVYKYKEEDVLRLDQVRESSRVRPLDEMVRLTLIQIDLALGEGGINPERMKLVGSELGKLAAQLQAGSIKIEEALAGIEAEASEVKEKQRDIGEFTSDLTEFLRDPSKKPIEILNDRERRTAERALSRGRGTKEALIQLEEKIEAHYEASEQ